MSTNFEITQQELLHLVTLKAELAASAITELSDYVKASLNQAGSTVVLDFKEVLAVPVASFKDLVVLQRTIKTKSCRMFSINLSADLTQEVRTQGLESTLGVVKDLESIRTAGHEDKNRPKTLQMEFVKPFIEATMNIFSVQVGINLTAGKPFAAAGSGEKRPIIEGDVLAGTLSVVAADFRGSVCIVVEKKGFLSIYEKMFKEVITEITDDSMDALAEILNMIYGQAKTVLNDRYGYGIQPALPTVLSGNSLQVYHANMGALICLPYTFDGHNFMMEIASEK
jgi:chemotaxis protein CheX